ncbi:hypothetical protein [Spiroplasma endosymbiont of Melieria omissa]|uniref:hypothetical protein n=1 Tax=Spiroplasma endosymbiont of Melieria omissa TaxID=3139324 RepID=UPI003CCA7D8C
MFIVTGWQCDYYENNIRCENYSKIQPHKDFNNNRVYCENHWKIVNKINQERKEFAIKQYKQKLIDYLNLCIEMDNKRLITKLYNENYINGSIEQTNVILQLIKNGVFD